MNTDLGKLNNKNIEYYTPSWVWDKLEQFIPKDKIIWEAFHNGSEASCASANYLKTLNFKVENPLCNFFDNDIGDICVSNPPYNIKKDVMLYLFKINKPFMLILPNIILNTLYFIEWLKNDKELQIIILPKRVDFINEYGNKKSTFHTLVVCWKMNLKERLVIS
jgi:hypothetical protein